jgi:RNA polymerase sigma-70 factor (ECF subfamily)
VAARPSPDPFANFHADDELGRVLINLNADLRLVVVLRFWADLTVDDIARRVGTRPGTVKSRLHRAIAQIRSALGSSSGGDLA